MQHELHISAYILWGKKSLIYVFHSSGLLIFSGPLDCQYFCLGGIFFLFPSWKKNMSLFSPSLQDIKEEQQQLKRQSFKKKRDTLLKSNCHKNRKQIHGMGRIQMFAYFMKKWMPQKVDCLHQTTLVIFIIKMNPLQFKR